MVLWVLGTLWVFWGPWGGGVVVWVLWTHWGTWGRRGVREGETQGPSWSLGFFNCTRKCEDPQPPPLPPTRDQERAFCQQMLAGWRGRFFFCQRHQWHNFFTFGRWYFRTKCRWLRFGVLSLEVLFLLLNLLLVQLFAVSLVTFVAGAYLVFVAGMSLGLCDIVSLACHWQKIKTGGGA